MKLHKKNGFSILAVLLFIAILVVSISAWALSGQTNNESSSQNASRVIASQIVNDGISFKTTYDRYRLQGVNQDNIIYTPNVANTTTTFNLADPTVGNAIPTVNAKAIKTNPATNQGFFGYMTYIASELGRTNGTGNTYEKMMMVAGIKDNVCKSINYIVSGKETIIDIREASTDFVYGITKAAPMSDASIYFPPGVKIGNSGCAGDLRYPDDNFYYIVLQIN